MKTKFRHGRSKNLPAGKRGIKNQGGILYENQQQHYGAKHSSPTFHQ